MQIKRVHMFLNINEWEEIHSFIVCAAYPSLYHQSTLPIWSPWLQPCWHGWNTSWQTVVSNIYVCNLPVGDQIGGRASNAGGRRHRFRLRFLYFVLISTGCAGEKCGDYCRLGQVGRYPWILLFVFVDVGQEGSCGAAACSDTRGLSSLPLWLKSSPAQLILCGFSESLMKKWHSDTKMSKIAADVRERSVRCNPCGYFEDFIELPIHPSCYKLSPFAFSS